MLAGYQARRFAAPTAAGHVISHDVYQKGEHSPAIVIIQEMPGIGPETLSLADTFVDQGFSVVLPHLFGPLGKISLAGNVVRVMCMRREFRMFERNQSSPVVDWLKALCRDLQSTHSHIGVIGMCLTGNFAISLMADDSVLAGVASQPSMPIGSNKSAQASLHMSPAEIDAAKARLDEHGPMMALRFSEDKLCTHAKFESIDRTFNSDRERIKLVELPGKGHSVLTLDLFKRGRPAQDALADVISYFKDRLQVEASS